MKKLALGWIILFAITYNCLGGTAGPSKDEIFLLVIPIILFILYLGIPPIMKFLRKIIGEWKEGEQLTNHENGLTG